ncbi:unnamed protein product, partial [Didymodactylos carnosus]
EGQVNRPKFHSFIKFIRSWTNNTIYTIDVSQSQNVTYQDNTLIFYTNDVPWTKGEQYYILFDEGVLYSNERQNSTVQLDENFWKFQVSNVQARDLDIAKNIFDSTESSNDPTSTSDPSDNQPASGSVAHNIYESTSPTSLPGSSDDGATGTSTTNTSALTTTTSTETTSTTQVIITTSTTIEIGTNTSTTTQVIITTSTTIEVGTNTSTTTQSSSIPPPKQGNHFRLISFLDDEIFSLE